jgi:hypothetical protein
VKEIQLTNSHLVAQVSDEDYFWVDNFNWQLSINGYATRHQKGKQLDLHREVAKKMKIDCSNQIDHKDQDALNNKRENLRPATRSQNQANRHKPAHNISGYKGVSWDKLRNKWRAQIKVDGKAIYLGIFYSKEAAYVAYGKAAKHYFGDFSFVPIHL